MTDSVKGKIGAVTAYVTMVGCLIAITMNLEPKYAFARFHTRQAFGIHLLFHATAIFLYFSKMDYIWMGLYLIYISALVICIVAVLRGVTTLVPVLGNHFQKWFTFIQ
ncbi:MAG: hypothetical protein AAGB24_05295 [Bacteroidota bacterium]